jgi:actin-related protein
MLATAHAMWIHAGLGDRLLSELRPLAPAGDTLVRIFAPKVATLLLLLLALLLIQGCWIKERKFTSWIGGSILAHLPTFKKVMLHTALSLRSHQFVC